MREGGRTREISQRQMSYIIATALNVLLQSLPPSLSPFPYQDLQLGPRVSQHRQQEHHEAVLCLGTKAQQLDAGGVAGREGSKFIVHQVPGEGGREGGKEGGRGEKEGKDRGVWVVQREHDLKGSLPPSLSPPPPPFLT